MYKRSGTLLERKFREYLLPTILTTVSVSMANVLNSMIAGNLIGETALAAIGLAMPVIYSISALLLLFALGGVTCAAIAKGRREADNADRIFTLTFISGMFAMLLLFFALLLFMQPITLALAHGDAELAGQVRAFLTPIKFLGPVMMLVLGMAYFVRIDGKPHIAAFVVLFANALNLVLAFVFIRFMDMGIAGAGYATLLGYTSGIFLMFIYLFSRRRTFRFVKLRGADIKRVKDIMSVGSPKALMQGLSFLRTLTLNALVVAALGATGMPAMAVCINALMLTAMFITGSNDTLLPIVGTLYGEKDYRGIRFSMRAGFKFMIIACIAMMALFLIIPGQVAGLFGINTPEGLDMARTALRMYALTLPLFGINTMLQNFFQTTGRVKLSAFSVSLNSFVLITLFALIFSRVNANLIWLSFVLAEAFTLIAVLGAGVIIRRKEKVNGVLLLRKDTTGGETMDITIPATTEAAVGLSEEVIKFCENAGTDKSGAMRAGIAVEEMAANTARYGHKGKVQNGVIDVLVSVLEDELILRLRDDGVPFNPTEYSPEEKHDYAFGGIEVVRKLAKEVLYSRQLGFNVCIITIPRTVKA